MTLFVEALQYGFFRRALLAVLLVCPCLSMLGCLVLETRTAYFSEAVGHAGLAGIAIGTLLGLSDPLVSLTGFSMLLALAITLARRRSAAPPDAAIGIFQSAAVALGVVLLSRGGGFARFSRYLIGDLLSISSSDLIRLAVATVLFVPLFTYLFNRVLLASLGESFARSRGLSPGRIQTAFALLLAVTVSASLQWIGILVIQAMVILPAAAARNLARSTAACLWGSVAIGLGSGVAGLFASYVFSTATGATVVLAAFAVFFATLIVKMFREQQV
jgi:zinc transport system permease protein